MPADLLEGLISKSAASTQCRYSLQNMRPFSGGHASTSSPGEREFIALNNLSDNPGATHYKKRLGRGIGSGLGKTSGRGHKGQGARTGRSPKLGFEGGQTPLRQRAPKRGFHNPHAVTWDPLNLKTLQEAVEKGQLQPGTVVTMKTLYDAGLLSKKIDHGIKLLGTGAEKFNKPLHLQVSQASASAVAAVERAGGSVTKVYYNKLGLRALLKPDWFARKQRLLPRPARPPPAMAPKFDVIGSLPPVSVIQPGAAVAAA
ncbi:g10779 [Coccomyxa elongata]